MLHQEGFVEIQVMHRQGKSIKAISRELGVSRNTVRRYLRTPQVPEYPARSARTTKLDPYHRCRSSRLDTCQCDL